jgi:threonine/homoserine/homoserine lactone efflux protein
MLNLLWITSSSFLAALSGAVAPGPVFALVASESIKNGKMAGPLIVLGHFIIECIVILMAFMGLQVLLKSEDVKATVGCVGGAVLIYMGLKLMLDAFRLRLEVNPVSHVAVEVKRIQIYRLIFSGFLASCSNPYFFLWWVFTGFPIMFSSLSMAGVTGFLLFLVGHGFADFLWFSFVSYSIYKGKRIFNRRVTQAILFTSAVLLISFAFYLIISSIKPLPF